MATTPVIRYNLKDRGRKHTGQPRNFDVRAICDAINSPACQEMVATRGMVGYYGHLPRIRNGMRPTEGSFTGGKYSPVEFALVTTKLSAYQDGYIEHQAEFLDTASGQIAAKLWDQHIGGFSSAIDQDIPEFFGFDYVAQPNFLANSFRGAALDSALGTMTYDDIYAAEQYEQAQATIMLLDSLATERVLACDTIEHLREQSDGHLAASEALRRRMAEIEEDQIAQMMRSGASLDSSGAVLPVTCSREPLERILRDAAAFGSLAVLPTVVAPPDQQEDHPLYGRILRRA